MLILPIPISFGIGGVGGIGSIVS
ncbi:unnamed protein product, partial [Rotaria sp. Silwood1]